MRELKACVNALVKGRMGNHAELGHFGMILDNCVYLMLAGIIEAHKIQKGSGNHGQRLDISLVIVKPTTGHIVRAAGFADGLIHLFISLLLHQVHTSGQDVEARHVSYS